MVGDILGRVQAGNKDAMGKQAPELWRVCHAFEAHTYLNALRATQLQPSAYVGNLAALPYMPALETVDCYDARSGRAVCAMLASHNKPHLTALVFRPGSDRGVSGLMAAIANNTQLQKLHLGLGEDAYSEDDDFLPDPSVPPAQPQLPHLPALCDLELCTRVTGTSAAAGLPLGLDRLSGLRQLTSLWFETVDRRDVQGVYMDEAYTVAAMLPVANALGELTALRFFTLSNWSCVACPTAHSCWQALASALPEMQHLTYLILVGVTLPPEFEPQYMQTLASALSSLASLRKLRISCTVCAPHPITAHTVDRRSAVSAHIAAAIGALTGLELLFLSDLHPLLTARDCHAHLHHLTGLTHLHLVDLGAPGRPPAEAADDGQALVGMLSGMTQLTYVRATDVHTSAAATSRFLSDAVPALPLLQTLVLPEGVDEASCAMLAVQIQRGRLPDLKTIRTEGSSAGRVAELNYMADRDVFQLPEEDSSDADSDDGSVASDNFFSDSYSE